MVSVRPDTTVLRRALGWLLAGVAVALGILGAASAATDHPLAAVDLAWLALGLLCFRHRRLALPLLAGTAALIEAFPLNFADSLTDRVPIFLSLSTGAGIPGAKVTAMDVMVIALALSGLGAVAVRRRWGLPGGALPRAAAVLAGVLLVAEVLGIARGGSIQVSIQELRSWEYLLGTFLVAIAFSRRREDILLVLWCVVVGTGIKGVQGTLRYLLIARGAYHNQILGHEEALLFTLFIALVLALWLFRVGGPMRRTATALLPFVLVADLANNRRTAWIILGVAVVLLLAVAIARRPAERRTFVAVAAGLAVFAAIYLAAFWHSNSTGVIAKPAEAIASAVSPNARDKSSDDYRLLENANLQIDIRSSPLLPAGFGRRVDKTIPMFDATTFDAFIDFIPHNQVLYIWLRLGTLGVIAFWMFVGIGISRSLQLTRSVDRRLLVFGAVAAVAVIGWVIEAWFDQGLTSARIAIVVGGLLGGVAWLLADGRADLSEEVAPPPAKPAARRRQAPARMPAPALGSRPLPAARALPALDAVRAAGSAAAMMTGEPPAGVGRLGGQAMPRLHRSMPSAGPRLLVLVAVVAVAVIGWVIAARLGEATTAVRIAIAAGGVAWLLADARAAGAGQVAAVPPADVRSLDDWIAVQSFAGEVASGRR